MNWSPFPKPFRGYPQTLILKALRGCRFPMVREPIADDHGNTIEAGMPPGVRNQVNELMQLWSRPDLTLQNTTGSRRKRNTDDDDNEGSGDDDNGGEKCPGSRDGSKGKKPLSKARRFSTRLQSQRIISTVEYKQASPSAKVCTWLDNVEDVGYLQATTPISPPGSENREQEEKSAVEHKPGQHNYGQSAAATGHHADQNAKATCHWMFGPQKTAADVTSDGGTWQWKIRARELASLQAREAALEKERKNRRYYTLKR